jgi:hypothetical protein
VTPQLFAAELKAWLDRKVSAIKAVVGDAAGAIDSHLAATEESAKAEIDKLAALAVTVTDSK